jgi:hypothetical protein
MKTIGELFGVALVCAALIVAFQITRPERHTSPTSTERARSDGPHKIAQPVRETAPPAGIAGMPAPADPLEAYEEAALAVEVGRFSGAGEEVVSLPKPPVDPAVQKARTLALLESYTLDPWMAWVEVQPDAFPYPLPHAKLLERAADDQRVQRAVDGLRKAESLVWALHESNASQSYQASAQSSLDTWREELMLALEEATEYPHWREIDAVWTRAIEEGPDE